MANADTIYIQRVSLQSDPQGWSVDAQFDFNLNSSLKEVVNRGIPLYFTTEFELTYPRWWWFDKKVIVDSQTMRLSFQPLTREYKVSARGGLQLGFSSLKEALAVIRHVVNWHVIDQKDVQENNNYMVAIRMYLNTNLMPKPFQINAVNNSDWNLSSDWKQFQFSVMKREK